LGRWNGGHDASIDACAVCGDCFDCGGRGVVFSGLGIDLATELPGAGGRPIPLVDRGTEPISELLA